MVYPTLEQYTEALHNPKLVLTDPELKAGTITKSGLGLPLALCGGFALTYTIKTGSKKYAVRCFHKKSDAIERRYNGIFQKTQSLNSGYFVKFEFQRQGIRINNNFYPIVKMEWASGDTLGEFIGDNYNKKQSLIRLRESFLKLSAFLTKAGISHGDVQPGNVMVSNNGSVIQLVDYDGMFVEDISNLGSSELGHRNFQHPSRRQQNFDNTLDRFSLIAIYVALRGLELDEKLWGMTHSDGDAFLFRANDYAEPSSSNIFQILFNRHEIAKDAKNFAAICKSPFEKIPSLEDFINGKNIPQLIIAVVTTPKIPTIQRYLSQYRVLDATNYSMCFESIGDKVELVGKIVEVKKDFARGRRPYIFINFGTWKGNIVKVSIWSDGLNKLKTHPDNSWIGKWISVTGLMEPPYISRRFKYSHLSISITENNQINVIDEKEARYRLNSLKSYERQEVTSQNNRVIIETMGSKSSKGKGRVSTPTTPNQAILQKMGGTATGQQTVKPSTGTPKPTYQGPYSPSSQTSNKSSSFGWLWIVIIVIILLALCGRK